MSVMTAKGFSLGMRHNFKNALASNALQCAYGAQHETVGIRAFGGCHQ